MANNPCPWPSIPAFPVHVALEVKNRHCALSKIALGIQRFYRWRKAGSPPQERIPWHFACKEGTQSLKEVVDEVVGPVFPRAVATEKLDGTNFGVSCSGLAVGRRQVVGGDSYQKCNWKETTPDGEAVTRVKGALCEAVGLDASHMQLYLYGELMCPSSKQIYTVYRDKGIGETWRCFGANVIYKGRAQEASTALGAAGFWHHAGDDGVITLGYSPPFRELLDLEGVTSVPVLAEGAVEDIVAQLEETMMGNDLLEGVVVNFEDGQRAKWKTGMEDGSANKGVIEKSYRMMEWVSPTGGFRCQGGDGPSFEPLYESMLRVTKNKPEKKKGRADNGPLSGDLLREAIESAKTKFASPEEFFEKGGDQGVSGRKEYSQLLEEEVQTDLAEPLAAAGGGSKGEAARQLRKAVAAAVQDVFGPWAAVDHPKGR